MICLYRGWPNRRRRRPRDLRAQMIAETEAFLTWALTHGDQVPRIPWRSQSGFDDRLIGGGGMRTTVNRWWDRTLRVLGR